MTMPIIPGLAGGSPDEGEGGNDLGALLEAVSDEDLAALEQSAQAAKDAGELDSLLGEGEEASAEEGDDEANESPEDELEETDEEQAAEEEAGEEDPTPHVRATEDAFKATAKAVDELSKLIEDAKEHEDAGVDLDKLAGYLEDAEAAAVDAQSALDTAQDDADAETAAEAATDAQAAQTAAEQALESAKASIAQDAEGAEEKSVPDEVKAMTAWARSVGGR